MDIPDSVTKKELAPKGTHVARVVSLIDLGTQVPTDPKLTPMRKINITFELCKCIKEFNGVKKPLVVSRMWTFTRAKGGKLREMIKAWKGVDISKESFKIDSLLGQECLVTISHSDDGQYANVESVSAVPTGLVEVPPAYNKLSLLGLNPGEFDMEVFKSLPDFIKAKITSTQEFRALKVDLEDNSGGTDEEEEVF